MVRDFQQIDIQNKTVPSTKDSPPKNRQLLEIHFVIL